jgi:hypothetical protein
MKKGTKFPTFSVLLLVVGIVWLLNEVGLISIKVPWIPIVLVIIALSMLYNHYYKK